MVPVHAFFSQWFLVFAFSSASMRKSVVQQLLSENWVARRTVILDKSMLVRYNAGAGEFSNKNVFTDLRDRLNDGEHAK